jgi:hypothetical protein
LQELNKGYLAQSMPTFKIWSVHHITYEIIQGTCQKNIEGEVLTSTIIIQIMNLCQSTKQTRVTVQARIYLNLLYSGTEFII